jgi:ATP-binding cassette subfamily B protein
MREQFGVLNAGVVQAVNGIEVIKTSAQEQREQVAFEREARKYRELFEQNGLVQARYLPPLVLVLAISIAVSHGLWLVSREQLTVGQLIAYVGLMVLLRFPALISVFTLALVQFGIVSAARILAILQEEADIDKNQTGHRGPMQGKIAFQNVSFGYGDQLVLKGLSFQANPSEVVAIVGETGSGKTTLTKLVNRIYDVSHGAILIDGVDVRDWNLDVLRSQIATIEQDVFLFSGTIRENIAFGLSRPVPPEAIEQAARDAQAHDYIVRFKDGYETTIGERGATLSGGQRQRIAIARALLADPRILILDDSTSAIDSATEDQIQKAMLRVLKGRTVILITHRLAQVRQAHKILVLRRGEIVDAGTHDQLMARCNLYQRIFSHYESTPTDNIPA